MFDFLKKKGSEIHAPFTGKIVDLKDVPDATFAERMVGDGVAIIPETDTALAPANGTVSMIFRTNHAFGMVTDDGLEMLIHIGLETVSLNGECFERLVEEGAKVTVGTPIIKVDLEGLKAKGFNTITPVLITGTTTHENFSYKADTHVTAGKDVAFTYKK